ncbi:MAG: DNA polymerase II [Caldisphaera sp.]|nr:MAG: DNA polymerase II [Caldisphaera sp.]
MNNAISFQLLDVSYEVIDNIPIINLWGRDDNNSKVLLTYNKFRPYFYLLLNNSYEKDKIMKAINKSSKPRSPIIGLDILSLNYMGRPVDVLKVTTVIPEMVREYRESMASIDGVKDVLEADIRFSLRYILDKNLYPMRWYKVNVKPINKDSSYIVDKIYEIDGELEEDESKINVDPLKDLKIMAFDIEVYNPQRTPDPIRDPIILISIRFNNQKEPILLEAKGHDDSELINEFIDLIKKEDPDIIVGYNQNRFDLPYLIERAKRYKIKLDLGRKRDSEPNLSVFGHYSIQGRLNVDLYDFADELQEIKVKSLDEVSDYLGVMPKDKRTNINWWQISEYWDDPEKRGYLKKYSLDDVESTIGLANKFLPFGAQLSIISGLPMDQVVSASVAFRLEARLMREAKKKGELMPNRIERTMESYMGAVVLKPEPGIHENVAVLDFASMYPSIMVKYNVGPDTLLKEEEKCNIIYDSPEVNHKFCGDRPAFMRQVLERFLKWRSEIKKSMKQYKEGSPEYNLLNERQRAIKVLANASYGYLGWAAARWYCKDCAEAITAWGRNLITKSINYAKSIGLKVYYGDTDSLFVENNEEKVNKVIDFVTKEMEFDIKIDKVYKRIFFTEAKKRYAGLLPDGKIDIVGFEAARGDWSELSKEVQTSIAEIVLKTGETKKAVEYVKKVIDDLKNGNIFMDKLIIWKTLTKDLDKYEAETPHAYVAKLMEKMGYKVTPGSKVGYVIIKGTGSISKKARPYFTVKSSDIDVNYYIDKQIIPAALRILSYFGINEKELKVGSKQPSLFDFLNSG